jgi:hypothetical protein
VLGQKKLGAGHLTVGLAKKQARTPAPKQGESTMHGLQQGPLISQQELVAEMCAAVRQGCALRAEYATQFREAAIRTRERIHSTMRSLQQVDRLLGSEKPQPPR